MMDCQHPNFSATVAVNRLEDSWQFTADVSIRCAHCGQPFQFLGLQPGVDLAGARVSIDGLEARLAICPQGSKPNPMQAIAFGIKGFQA